MGKLKIHMPQLLLAFLCFWMSGIAQLHHTDRLDFLQTYAVKHASQIQGKLATTAPDTCAACEWDQLQSAPHTPAVVVILSPLFNLDPQRESKSRIFNASFDHYALRGPPYNCS